ncbi:uncharacterized protein LOC111713276, partial [Eurytemora carolleeae]|uniref:uncharacterized protein LOC111713276 n=1 Tax=Eurytemora carolleeae TaxID=1294199 RepID=UPI000C756567
MPLSSILFPDLFRNMYGNPIHTVSMDWSIFIQIRKTSAGFEFADSMGERFINIISKKINCSFTASRPSDGLWGSFVNGSFTGVVGEVERGQADLTFDLSITYQRNEVVDFPDSIRGDPLTFAISTPLPLPQSLSVVRPFPNPVLWIFIIIACAATGVCLYILQRVSSKTHQGMSKSDLAIGTNLLLSF